MRLILTFLLCLFCSPAHAWMNNVIVGGGVPAAGGGSSYELDENFENSSGYDESWTVVSGTIDTEYATSPAPLRGTYSGYVGGGDEVTYTVPSATEAWGHFLFNYETQVNVICMRLLDSSGGYLAAINPRNDGSLIAVQGTLSAGAGATGTLVAGSTYHIWWHWKAESSDGALDGEITIYIGTTTTRPTTAYLSTTVGDAEASVDRLQVRGDWAGTYIIDQIVYSSSPLTEVDP